MSETRTEDFWSPAPPWGPETAFLLVAADFALILFLPEGWGAPGRIAAALLFPLAFFVLRRWAPASLGLSIGRVREGVKACGVSILIAVLLVGLGAAAVLALRTAGVRIALPAPSAAKGTEFVRALLVSVLLYPVLEEWIYRGILYPPLEARTGRLTAIVVSGVVFQALHLAYGKTAPHYFIGGMILAWAFSRGRSLIYPVFLHALWNLFVALADAARAQGWVPV